MTKTILPCSGPGCKNTVARSPSEIEHSKTKQFFCCRKCQHESRVTAGGKFRRKNAFGQVVRPEHPVTSMRRVGAYA